MWRKLEYRLVSFSLELVVQDVDATFIVERLTSQRGKDIEFFAFSEDWIKHSQIRGVKNYSTMLNSIETYIGSRRLSFSHINYRFLKGYEDFLNGKERAMIMYQRTKTKARRSDGTYIEVKIHPFTKELVRIYKGDGHVSNFLQKVCKL